MICKPCGEKNHEYCDNLWTVGSGSQVVRRQEETKTWCDCQHRESWPVSKVADGYST